MSCACNHDMASTLMQFSNTRVMYVPVPPSIQGSSSSSTALVTAGASRLRHSIYALSFAGQMRECLNRTSKAYWRMPAYNFMRLLITMVSME